MRILFISENYPPYVEGGAEISTALLARWLSKNHTVSVACSRRSGGAWIDQGIAVYPIISTVSVGKKDFLSIARYAVGIVAAPLISAVRIVRLIKKLDPAVVNVVGTIYYLVPLILAIRIFSRRPVLVDCRDYSFICPAQFKNNEVLDPTRPYHGYRCLAKGYQTRGGLFAVLAVPFAVYESCIFNWYKSLLRHSTNRAVAPSMVANSRYVRDQLVLNGFRSDNIVVINNISQPRARETKGASPELPTFVYAGRIEKEKGVWDLVAAAELLEHDRGPFRVAIAGSGSELLRLQEHVAAQKMRSVWFMGSLEPEAVIALYQRSLAVVAPSRWPEPFGRFILESMTAGAPLVTTATGGTPEGVADKVTGLIVEAGNAVQLAAAMKYFMDNPGTRRAMQEAIVEKQKNYLPEVVGEQRLKLYREVLSIAQRGWSFRRSAKRAAR